MRRTKESLISAAWSKLQRILGQARKALRTPLPKGKGKQRRAMHGAKGAQGRPRSADQRFRKYSDAYQVGLILFATISMVMIGAFIYRELFPEYKEYQNAYIALEEIRGEDPAFSTGIKQVLYRDGLNGPQQIDRCISCHVATDLPHFSPTVISRDINGQIRIDAQGIPLQEPNPDYIFNLPGAENYRSLERVLVMHPLLGSETRPFEYHPVEQYGCTTCHSGNGRSVNAKRAHGPVFDEEYEAAEHQKESPYVEPEENAPQIAYTYNFKPDHSLLFQTTPLLPGALMEAKCVQCHEGGQGQVDAVLNAADRIGMRKTNQLNAIEKGIAHDNAALQSLVDTRQSLVSIGLEATIAATAKMLQDPRLTPEQLDAYDARLRFLKSGNGLDEIDAHIAEIHKEAPAKIASLALGSQVVDQLNQAISPIERLSRNQEVVANVDTTIDHLLGNFQRGKELYFSQACYACHRVDGLSRGAVGPDLTEIGRNYPWYVKQSIVWPQGKLPISQMPNFKLDHEEVEDLLAFLMAQRNDPRNVADAERQANIAAWEAGHKLPWEKPIPPGDITNVGYGMKVFATEGCAACHKLQGFEGNVSYAGDDQFWFFKRFPETIGGRDLADQIVKLSDEIDVNLLYNGKTGTILEELPQDVVKAYYTNFKVASRELGAEHQDQLERVLTMFIQEYGLGRDIAPRLNWSGVWRDDQWLTGHFLNPAAYSARSIMPAFPFDLAKFYALNNMLHVVGAKNLDKLRSLWEIDGFSPQLAYQLQCAACHGTHKQGNGIVSEWIYPIPKNLRNAEFLTHLTREQAINSITHGVAGTPMPPWGKVGGESGGQAVMTEPEIEQLVDWLYTSIPGSVTTSASKKWDYQPEGAAADGYISKAFYTTFNIDAGQTLFLEHCAVCHGTEGAGTGARAETMQDAKPRILSNLPWLRTRDDNRLLRSIKFGVPGTSMLPWGDQTTPLQRRQLVAFIRTISEEKRLRDDLYDTLYDIFDTKILAIEKQRAAESPERVELEEQYEETIAFRKQLTREDSPAQAAKAFESELVVRANLKPLIERDEELQAQIAQIKEEKELFSHLGQVMLARNLDEATLQSLFAAIRDRAKAADVVATLDAQIAQIEQQLAIADGKIRSQERTTQVEELNLQRNALINLRTRTINTFTRLEKNGHDL